MITEKCVNIPIIQEIFINILKNSSVKTIKTSAKIIAIIIIKNTVTQNALLPNYKYKENEYKNMQSLSNFLKNILEKVVLDVRF